METPGHVPSVPPPGVDASREGLVALAVCCPITGANPIDCPLHGVRQLDDFAIIDWIDGLSEEEQTYLRSYHHCCQRVLRSRAGLATSGHVEAG